MARQAGSDAEDQLDSLKRLKAANHACYRPQNTGFRASGRKAGIRRIGKHTAVTRGVFKALNTTLKHSNLAFGTHGTAKDQRSPQLDKM